MPLKWRPRETAPKDGTPILVTKLVEPNDYWPDGKWVYVLRWDGYTSKDWQEADGEQYYTFTFTHWMPLSELPNAG